MEAIFIILFLLGGLLFVPVVLFVRVAALRRRVDGLEAELARMRGEKDLTEAPAEPALPAAAGPAPAAQAPPPVAPEPGLPPPPAPVVPAPTPEPGRFEFPPPPGPRPAPTPEPEPREAPARPAPFDTASLEQLIGGVWLQNLGSVVLLLGVFLMILWGYTTGRFGPQALVGGGVLLGLALAWRGDRVARGTPLFGHALIGVGLGVVYLTLFLGYLLLHVLSAPVALALLVLVSFAAFGAGLRYKVQLIAAFGVVGAFLPQFMARWLGLPGFEITPAFLLGYLAAIDLLVFALAARAGWSRLDLVAVVLSAFTWLTTFPGVAWGWGVQAGLASLFTVLGLAPLPRLVRTEGRLRPSDLAVVAISPLALLAASAPFLSWAERGAVAAMLFALAAAYLVAALWVDARRPERDLWVPLTAAATLFATAGLERSLGPVYTALAWAAEGAVLVALGLRPRGGWLRAMGQVVLLAGALALLMRLDDSGWTREQWPVFYGAGLRDLSCIAALFVAAGLLARRRGELGSFEQDAPEAWTVVGHLLLAYWLSAQANHLASALTEPGGRFHPLPPPVGIEVDARRTALAVSFSAVGWLAQAVFLARTGARGALPLRLCAAALGVAALFTTSLRSDRYWWTDLRPIAHAASLLDLAAVGLVVAVAVRFAAERERLTPPERRTAEVWATGACLMLMLWSVRETRHVAVTIARPDALFGEPADPEAWRREVALAAALASVAWLVQAIALLVLGWLRDSAFLRWCGLVLMGVTLFKFLFFDLAAVDVFWRFLTALAVGAVMLAFSYAYQRRIRRSP